MTKSIGQEAAEEIVTMMGYYATFTWKTRIASIIDKIIRERSQPPVCGGSSPETKAAIERAVNDIEAIWDSPGAIRKQQVKSIILRLIKVVCNAAERGELDQKTRNQAKAWNLIVAEMICDFGLEHTEPGNVMLEQVQNFLRRRFAERGQ